MNQMPFMTKELSKEIMTRFRLTDNILKIRIEENKMRYAKQRNKYLSILRSAKKKQYGNLDVDEKK